MPNNLQLVAGDVFLHQGKGIVANLIQFFDGSQYSHASLVLDPAEICEAAPGGVKRTPLAGMADEYNFVDLYRLIHQVPTLDPVVARGSYYAQIGDRYAYEQLVLLALLSTVRKIPLPPIVRWLLRKLLDAAASVISAILAAGRQPMICSELVYRCFDEAIPGDDDDVYTLHINQLPNLVTLTARGLQGARGVRGLGIHPESLFAAVATQQSTQRWLFAPASVLPAAPEPNVEALTNDLEPFARQYLDAVAKPHTSEWLAPSALASDPEIVSRLNRFVTLANQALRKQRQSLSFYGTADLHAEYSLFSGTVADFVTPKDLRDCADLGKVGRYAGEGS